MPVPALKLLPQGLPSWLQTAAEAANDNVALTARQLAEKRWVGPATQKVAATGVSGIAAAGVDAGLVAVAIPAFLGTIGLAAYAYVTDRSYYDNKHFTPCGTDSRHPEYPKSIFAALPNASTFSSGRDLHPIVLDAPSRNAVLSYARSQLTPAIDKPPEGKSIPVWMSDMAAAARIEAEISDKQNEINHHRQNGNAHLARHAEQELNSIQGANFMYGHRLQATASASGDGSSAGSMVRANSADQRRDAADERAERAYKDALAHALMLPDSAVRAVMLTGFVGEFAEYRRWPLFQAAVTQALISANGVPDRERAMQLKVDLANDIVHKLTGRPGDMPGPEVRHYLNDYVHAELPSAKRDPQYMGALTSLQGILQGWERILQTQAATMTLSGLTALAVESGEETAVSAEKDKTPLPVALTWSPAVEGAQTLIRINGTSKTMAGWISQYNRGGFFKIGIGVTVLASIWGSFSWQTAIFYSAVTLFLGAYIGTNPSIKGVDGKLADGEADRQISGANFPEVAAVWYERLLGEKDDDKSLKWLDHSTKTVDGMPYDLAHLMEIDPLFKRANQRVGSVRLLAEIEARGRRWSEAELTQIRTVHIRWKQADVQSPHFMSAVTWLAAHGNNSVVHWVYDHAQHGVPMAQKAMEQLVSDANPTAIHLLAKSHSRGDVTITRHPK